MLTKQGNTQVYSPFGSYVVEQHQADCERPARHVPEPQANDWQDSEAKQYRKAA